jgi:hypothetical protein
VVTAGPEHDELLGRKKCGRAVALTLTGLRQ